jgi:predicted lipoprotein with Yx(FWY)xxD motif
MKRTSMFAVAVALAVASCGGDDGGTTTAPPPDTTTATPTTTAEPGTTTAPPSETTTTVAATTTTAGETTTTAAAGSEIVVAETALGQILADGDGFSLSIYTPDDAGGVATCTGACAATWPAVAAASAGAGVEASLLGTTSDGLQATYNGWPLYYFANDAAAGDTNGQGVNEVWYVVDGAGSVIN